VADPHRPRVVESLLCDGPQIQAALRERFDEDKHVVSDSINALLDADVISRDRPRGDCYLPRSEGTLRLLQAAADLAERIAVDQAEAAKARAKELRRQSCSQTPTEAADHNANESA
jgi:DNA-binding MarR family transcriptional regulator